MVESSFNGVFYVWLGIFISRLSRVEVDEIRMFLNWSTDINVIATALIPELHIRSNLEGFFVIILNAPETVIVCLRLLGRFKPKISIVIYLLRTRDPL